VSRGRSWLVILVLGACAITAWVAFKKATPPEVDFTKVVRETMVSTLPTNGKVEPIEWLPVRAERTGLVTKVLVSRGQQVSKDEPLIELDTRVATAEVSKAQAAIKEAQTQQQVLEQGGRIAERQQTEADLARARLDLEAAQKTSQTLERLVAKQAATRQDLDLARQTVQQLQLRIESLEEHKAGLVTGTDKEIARARVQQAESTAAIARTILDLSIIHAPMDGTLYDFDLKQGAFVNAGDPVAKVGRLDRVRVTVYVDEPDLGKVRKGEVVNITWDALPGHQWKGEVDKLPTQIVPLGTRQVGEVGCVIENPQRDLIPNSNINAEIQATVVEKALALPKEAIRREGSETGVYVLQGDRVVWRKIGVGVSSYTKSQILSGLSEGDAVALPTEKPLKNGVKVEPVYE
jgi:HlyD family secretion protein